MIKKPRRYVIRHYPIAPLPPTPPSDQRICVGVIVAAHGIRGEVKLKALTQKPENVAAYGVVYSADGSQQFRLRVVGMARGLLIARLKGVTTRNAAEALARQKTKLFINRQQLPPLPAGQYYHDDLHGLAALDAHGQLVAQVRAVMNFGAGDILAFQPEPGFGDGKEFLLPLKPPFVDKIDLTRRQMVIEVPEGFFASTPPEKSSEKSRKKP